MDYNSLRAHQAGVGNVYFVVLSGATNEDYIKDHHQQTYLDGNTAVQATITLANAATVAERNDYIIVSPDATDYDEGATLTLANASTHLICPDGLGAEYGSGMRAATIDPNANVHAITITGRGVEVAGFYIRGYAEKLCITSTGHGCWIHHNDCAITSTTSAAGGIFIDNGGAGSKVENNFVFTSAGNSDTIVYGIHANPFVARTIIKNNYIVISNGNTMTYGIRNEAPMGLVQGNVLNEVGVATGHPVTGTFTNGIYLAAATMAVDNRIGITDTSKAIVGGTAINCVNNICSLNGGTIAQ